ncbi:unnamed protein product [Leuciscus chuanchicus]
MMETTFPLHRQTIVMSCPPVNELLDLWPALKIESEGGSDEPELDGVAVGLLTVISDHDTSPVHYHPVRISVIIKSDAVVSLPRLGNTFLPCQIKPHHNQPQSDAAPTSSGTPQPPAPPQPAALPATMARKKSLFLDSLGESKQDIKTCLETTRAIMRNKGCNVSRWTCDTVPHPKQSDSTSCGVFALKWFHHMCVQGPPTEEAFLFVVPLSVEVGNLVGAHKERYLEKLEIAGLDTDPYLLPPSVFTDLIKSPSLPNFRPDDLYHYVVNGVSPYTGADLKAFKSLDAYQFFVAG